MVLKYLADALLIAFFWFLAVYTLDMRNIDKIAFRQEERPMERYMSFGAKIVLLIVMLTGVGLFFSPQNTFVNSVRELLESVILSRVIYVASILLIMVATVQITRKTLQTERYMMKAQKKAISTANGLLVMCFIWVVFFFQSIYSGQLRYIYSGQNEPNMVLDVILNLLFILLPAAILFVNVLRYIHLEKIRILGIRISFPFVLFIALSHTILVKLFAIFDLVIYILHRTGLLPKVEGKNDYDDKLLMGSSMSYGKVNAKINVYFLTAYFVMILIVWSLQNDPFTLTNDLYANGMGIEVFIGVAILSFWLIEWMARKIGKFGKFLRPIFIPTLFLLTIYPFYSGYANVNGTGAQAIYHMMSSALGTNKYLFFLCMGILQCAIAYILHIVTGEAHNDRHHYTVIPIMFIVQIMILSVMYPTFLAMPPYDLLQHRPLILSTIFVAGLLITTFVGMISYQLFTSHKSDWSLYVNEYWKVKERVYVIVGLITIFVFLPFFSLAANPIHNTNITYAWEKDYLKDDNYTVNNIIQTSDEGKAYIMASSPNNRTKVISIFTATGMVSWENEYQHDYADYKLWDDNTVVLLKRYNQGFTVIDLHMGKIIFDYSIDNNLSLEFLNLEVNDRAVLMTVNTEQYIYDHYAGQMKLDTIGNNFYHLVGGNNCALTKNSRVYVYQNERWEKYSGIQGIETADYVYYDENGMIIFSGNQVYRYNPELTRKTSTVYDLPTQKYDTTREYIRKGDEVTFFLNDKNVPYAYVFNNIDFTYRIINLLQKIEGYNDAQQYKITDDPGTYMLFDPYQLMILKDEDLLARQWYELPLTQNNLTVAQKTTVLAEPGIFGKYLIWSETKGETHCVLIP